MDNLLDLQLNTAVGQARSQAGPDLAGVRNEDEARAAAQEFEGFFLSQLLEAMFAETGENNPFGGGAGEKAFRGLLREEYAKVMAQSGGLGLTDRLTTEILRYQEMEGQGS